MKVLLLFFLAYQTVNAQEGLDCVIGGVHSKTDKDGKCIVTKQSTLSSEDKKIADVLKEFGISFDKNKLNCPPTDSTGKIIQGRSQTNNLKCAPATFGILSDGTSICISQKDI